jgi:4'-phosphopantetheinyl transferase
LTTNPNSPESPALAPHSIHVYIVALELEEAARHDLQAILSEDEKSRAARFHFDRDRLRYMMARGSLRRLLAAYVHAHPADIRFAYSERGKPSLLQPSSDVRFNISHSDNYALLAFTRSREIGVDIEKIKPEVEAEKLAKRFFSAQESRSLQAVAAESQASAFYRGWTCKEALLKAWGTGLYLPLDCFDVELDPARRARLLATRPDASLATRWSVQSLEAPAGYAAAIAVEGNLSQLEILHSRMHAEQ